MDWFPDQSVTGKFWTALLPKIEKHVREIAFLRSHSNHLNYVYALRHVPEIYRDQNEEPLFEDLTEERYLGYGYEKHLDKLRQLGLQDLTGAEIVKRVEADAEKAISRLATISAEDDWHKRVAKLLNYFLKKPRSPEAKQIRDIPLIPLTDGTWDSAGSIYYPNVDSISIPRDLNLSLVDPDSIQHNPARKLLFDNLGVTTAPREKVRKLILRREKEEITLKESIDHLRYLWWTHVDGEPALDGAVNVFNLGENPLLPRRHEIYFYHVRDLLISNESNKDDDDSDAGGSVYDEVSDDEDDHDEVDTQYEEFGYEKDDELDNHINFLHPAYLASQVTSFRKSRSSWRKWLHDCIGVQEYLLLADRCLPEELSGAFQFIRDDRPEKLVVVLKNKWKKYKRSLSIEIQTKISEIKVPCTRKSSSNTRLGNTYLPLKPLRDVCKKFSVLESFPFLKVSVPNWDDSAKDWEFLARFGVGTKLDLKFYLSILRCFLGFSNEKLLHIGPKLIYSLYEDIEHQRRQVDESQDGASAVR